MDIKPSSFDAVAAPAPIDQTDPKAWCAVINDLTFIEIKTSNQERVKPGFAGFFFALTENEIIASEQLGARHQVALYDNRSGEMLMTSVSEIVARAKSTTWQLSVQL